jgi:hypothetical protein
MRRPGSRFLSVPVLNRPVEAAASEMSGHRPPDTRGRSFLRGDRERPTSRILSALIGVSALVTSGTGLAHPAIYAPIVASRDLPFVFSQDLAALGAALGVLLLSFVGGRRGVRISTLRAGIVGYLLYAYGQYVIGALYSRFYFAYQAIFGLSIFFFIDFFANLPPGEPSRSLPRPLRLATAVSCAAIAVLFAYQWIPGVWQTIQSQSRPEPDAVFSFNHADYDLDLCFFLPAFAWTSVLLFRQKALGVLLSGILQLMGFILMLEVALGFAFQPLFGHRMAVADAMQFFVVSGALLTSMVFYFACARTEAVEPGASPPR